MIFRSLLTYICISALLMCISGELQASQKWTLEDTQIYFKELPLDKQKAFIRETISTLHKDLPIQIDSYSRLVGMVYLPSSNAVTEVFVADIPYKSIDQKTIDEFSFETKTHSINSLCSKIMFKMFMFETDTIVRLEYDYATGQRLFNWTIDKNDCLNAGYSYP